MAPPRRRVAGTYSSFNVMQDFNRSTPSHGTVRPLHWRTSRRLVTQHSLVCRLVNFRLRSAPVRVSGPDLVLAAAQPVHHPLVATALNHDLFPSVPFVCPFLSSSPTPPLHYICQHYKMYLAYTSLPTFASSSSPFYATPLANVHPSYPSHNVSNPHLCLSTSTSTLTHTPQLHLHLHAPHPIMSLPPALPPPIHLIIPNSVQCMNQALVCGHSQALDTQCIISCVVSTFRFLCSNPRSCLISTYTSYIY